MSDLLQPLPYNLFAPVSPKNVVNAYRQPQGQKKEDVAGKPQSSTVVDGTSSTAGMDYLNSLYTSPVEEERRRRSSVMNQRLLAVGDAIRHIGNIAHTVGGAPSQTFTDPVAMEQARYERGKAVRDRANQVFFTYQQQKAEQDKKQKQWEQQFGLQMANAMSQAAYRQRQGDIAEANALSLDANRRADLARQTAADEARNRYNEARLKQDKWYKGASLGIQQQRLTDQQRRTNAYVSSKANGGGRGSGVAPLDTPRGQITPNGRNYSNQLLQMWGYANQNGLLNETDEMRRLRALGLANEADDMKRQQVMDLLRTNQALADYATTRLGWSYGGMDLGLDGDGDDDMDLGLE